MCVSALLLFLIKLQDNLKIDERGKSLSVRKYTKYDAKMDVEHERNQRTPQSQN